MGFTDNPIINSPFDRPQWHFELDDEGQPTGKKLPDRRESVQVVPVPAARRRGPRQRELALEEKTTSNTLVNAIRNDVDQWRELPPSQWGVTPETQRLLLHWRDPHRERKQFFCQREAIETLIWLTEVAPKEVQRRYQDRERGGQSRPLSSCLQNGDRRGQDHGHGDDHRLAGGEQGAPSELQGNSRMRF